MIRNYNDLIRAARSQSEPQRLLFVFCRAELPEDASAEERAAFEQGQGGALVPVICVDKSVDEAGEFSRLAEESRATGEHWDMVFVAAMSGRAGLAPSSDDVQQPLAMMVESIRLGHLGNYLPLDSSGQPLALG